MEREFDEQQASKQRGIGVCVYTCAYLHDRLSQILIVVQRHLLRPIQLGPLEQFERGRDVVVLQDGHVVVDDGELVFCRLQEGVVHSGVAHVVDDRADERRKDIQRREQLVQVGLADEIIDIRADVGRM